MNAQDSTQRLRTLCLQPQLDGSLKIESRGAGWVLRRRHSPWSMGIFGAGLMGGLCYYLSRSNPPPGVLIWGILFSIALCTSFVVAAVIGDRQPPLLEYDAEARVLILPQGGETFSIGGGLVLGVQRVHFHLTAANDHSLYGALSILQKSGGEPLPVFVESCPEHLIKQARKFADLAGIELLELPDVSLRDTGAGGEALHPSHCFD